MGFPWISLLAFQRVVTNPRASERAWNAERAWQYIDAWLDADNSWIPTPGDMHARILKSLLVDGDLRGNLVTDAHLAALAIEYGVGICSVDTGFARFSGVRWLNPTA